MKRGCECVSLKPGVVAESKSQGDRGGRATVRSAATVTDRVAPIHAHLWSEIILWSIGFGQRSELMERSHAVGCELRDGSCELWGWWEYTLGLLAVDPELAIVVESSIVEKEEAGETKMTVARRVPRQQREHSVRFQ